MFVELMPLLAGRTVMITVARADDNTLRVNVIPTTKPGEAENPALTTPLSYTGTPEELDAELARQLGSYVEGHRQLGSTLAQAKAEMEAAAQEEARRKAEERRKAGQKTADKNIPSARVESTSAAPAEPATAPASARGVTLGLFETLTPDPESTQTKKEGCRMPE